MIATVLPCLLMEYASQLLWSTPLWQVAQASGLRDSAAENSCRVWQESHLFWSVWHMLQPSAISRCGMAANTATSTLAFQSSTCEGRPCGHCFLGHTRVSRCDSRSGKC